ncbi:DUF6074 family protein [Mesorhizobium sp. NPDC059054]|uniref:DUF6074 family protein n=1 Tax=Mesorhizobium sp. NPDC059054 TaxID=3346711 RepID=UPI00369291FE
MVGTCHRHHGKPLRGMEIFFVSAQASPFTIGKPSEPILLDMAELIPFPLHSRAALVRSITDDLEDVHGPAANVFWQQRMAGIVATLRSDGVAEDAIRREIFALQLAVQSELQRRAYSTAAM